jgi:hypothetical protein
MSDFQKPIDRINRDKREDWVTPPIQKVEKDKKTQEEPYAKDLKSEISKSALFATLTFFCKKFLNLFSQRGKSSSLFFDIQQILENLYAFRKMLQILANEDQSHNPEFTLQLSELWHNLLDDCNIVTSFEKNIPEFSSKIKLIIKKINDFPSTEDHQLGYYLTEYAGKEWLPFPFMDILLQLHQEYQKNLQMSELASWISVLNEAIFALDVKTDLS